MNKFLLFFVCIALGAASSCAESVVTNVLVSQRWPWSEKVDVDFVLSGDQADIDVYATWDALKGDDSCGASRFLLGSILDAAPGAHRLTWDPSASPLAGKTLTGFAVSPEIVASEAHTYLVIDLRHGGLSYLAEPDGANGGWSDDYKTTKMAFRRIPAGSYQIGEPKATYLYLGESDTNAGIYEKIAGRRTVTFTHDFYVGVFRYTAAQQSWLEKDCAGGDTCSARLSYEALRGGTNAVDALNIDWPMTRYKVATNSVVARLRAKAGGVFTVDLCEDDQWEVAARTGTTTFWPTGGTIEESYSTLSNYIGQIASWRGNGYTGLTPVGQKTPNAWGLYDIVAAGAAEWVLDSCSSCNKNRTLPSERKVGETDPIGNHGKGLRVYRGHGGIGSTAMLFNVLPALRRVAEPTESSIGVRFCIHLQPLAFKE